MNKQVYNLKSIERICSEIGNEKVRRMFKNCFFSTLLKCVDGDDREPFVITGDIKAMWLRDSAAQMMNYVDFISENRHICNIVEGVIIRQIRYFLSDNYANAFNKTASGMHCWADITEMSDIVWERKYEVDSVCHVLRLINKFIKVTQRLPRYSLDENPGENRDENSDSRIGMISTLYKTVIELWTREQRHFENSKYRFTREHTWERDTLHNDGMGNNVNYTGMTWSGFRPSDDACVFGYNIPSNFFAAECLLSMENVAIEYLGDYEIAAAARSLRSDILRGISNYGTYVHHKYDRIYAYETDGFGNYVLMDDANTPSLLSLRYLSSRVIDDRIYENTRKFVLSSDNPTYYEGIYGKGIGSVHTPEGNIWHIALCIQAISETDVNMVSDIFKTIIATDADTLCMHESFNKDDPRKYTREWFSWADSMFAELVLKIYKDDGLKHLLNG